MSHWIAGGCAAWALIAVRQLHGRTARALRSLSVVVCARRCLGLLAQGCDGLAQCQELLFGVAHQLHEDMPLAPAAAAKAPHDFCELLLEAVGLLLESGVARRLHCLGDVCR